MEIIRTKNKLTDAIRSLRAVGKTIALVPTMGALHGGHISLVDLGLQNADVVIATIFVNPTQFGPNEDFSKYPRTEKEDVEKLGAAGTVIAYIPDVSQMYEDGAQTSVHVGKIGSELCGAVRPGHFDGVATIVTKLFMQTTPDVAIFGEKDYQQLYVIRQVTRDLDIPVKIIGAPIMREADGLAMSSRNRYLSESERKIAATLNVILKQAIEQLHKDKNIQKILEAAKEKLLAAGFTKVDYVELRDAKTLAPVTEIKNEARLLAAGNIGTTRLIDNMGITL